MLATNLEEILQGYVLKILDEGGAIIYHLENLKTSEVQSYDSFQTMMLELEASLKIEKLTKQALAKAQPETT